MPKINAALLRTGVWITDKVGTMPCALLFLLIAFGATPGLFPAWVTVVCVWIAQVVLQLVLLPIIMVGQNIHGAKTEALIQQIEALAEKIDAAVEGNRG